MPRAFLTCHPQTPCALVDSIEVWVSVAPPCWLRLSYRIRGQISALRIPSRRPGERTDGLWRHTCCEAFMQISGEVGYWECNLSPSTQWALYRFSDYRTGMTPVPNAHPVVIRCHEGRNHLDLGAILDFKPFRLPTGAQGLRLGLTSVIETGEGGFSFWALSHPAGQPDFHHPAGFTLSIPWVDPAIHQGTGG